MTRPPPSYDLSTPASRERALDDLGAWFVEAIIGVEGDRAAVLSVMRQAVVSFYDIREAADQPRGEYAGHFFIVDAVGLGDTQRPVPWQELHRRIGSARVDVLMPIFDEAEHSAR